MSAYTPEKYKADGGFSVAGLPLLLFILLAAAVALGWLASFIGQWFYLIFLFPLGMGCGLAFAGLLGGHAAKMRNLGIAAVLGVVSAAVALLAMHYFDYRRFVSARDAVLAQVEQPLAVDQAKNALGGDSFPAFMDFQAVQGVSIGKGGGMNLGYYGTWIYWSLEFLGVALCVVFGLMAGASSFCPACDTWKDEKPLGTFEGEGSKVVEVLQAGDVRQLDNHEPARQGGKLVLSAAVCPKCRDQSSIAVKLEQITTNEKGEKQKSELTQLSYPGEALAEFEGVFQRARDAEERRRKDAEEA